ncbi:hypothetical protein BDY19DRAFT_945883 [Irpex rosettiformis]|uniref:Uncharacterized protein n=1 Tax=Irpex rosettiformis TaxID=378272 RepID=A0ACB8U3L7_9APHY|nr:hypothetical protein BDY19DRAFT_945883 [Irpex rosettiformis]
MLIFYRIYKAFTSLFARRDTRDHFAPHAEAGFEGYYTRIRLDDGGNLVVVFCWVKDAQERARCVHVSYSPALGDLSDTGESDVLESFKREIFSDSLTINVHPPSANDRIPFSVYMPDIGTMKIGADTINYHVSCPTASGDGGLELDLHLTNHVPWSSRDILSSPMGFFTRISSLLPLNWHVYSLASIASGTISYNGKTRRISGIAHVEKNWGTSFPSGWIWSQSFAVTRGLPIFKARVGLQTTVYCGYRSTIAFTKKLAIKINAPTDSFMGISCPLPDGHRPNFAFESFSGRTIVSAWERRWPWQTWTMVEEGECGVAIDGRRSSALEFGGTYSHRVREEEGAKKR